MQKLDARGIPGNDAPMRYSLLPSPVGELLLSGDGEALAGIWFASDKRGRRRPPVPAHWQRDDGAFAEARRQLEAWFAGELTTFDLRLAPRGSAFQQQVWAALRTIPFGATASYGDIARRIGQPNAARAVGLANGSNPIPIVVPCHRVIGADGSLTGFGGGLDRKRWLLAHERRVAGAAPRDTAHAPYTADLFAG